MTRPSSTIASVALRNETEIRADVYEGRPHAKLEVIDVRNKYRGQGFCKLLYELAETHARKLNVGRRLRLLATTGEGSSSAIIHGKYGFKPLGLSPSKESLLNDAIKSKKRFFPNRQKKEGVENMNCDMYLPEKSDEKPKNKK